MPIDKTTGEKICINGCGILKPTKSKGTSEIGDHIIPSINEDKEEGLWVNAEIGFALEIWLCSECGYIELYDPAVRSA